MIWRSLSLMLIEESLWTELVRQKDRRYSFWRQESDKRLHGKFPALRTRTHQISLHCQRHHISTANSEFPHLTAESLSLSASCQETEPLLPLPTVADHLKMDMDMTDMDTDHPFLSEASMQSSDLSQMNILEVDSDVQKGTVGQSGSLVIFAYGGGDLDTCRPPDCDWAEPERDTGRQQSPIPVAEIPGQDLRLLQLEEFPNPLPEIVPLDPVPILVQDDIRLQSDIVNLSSTLLMNDQCSVLELGLGFRRVPSKMPILQLVAGTELAARELAKQDQIPANTFRISCTNTIRCAEMPHCNLNSRQRTALTGLRNNQALNILTADKGGKVTILDVIAYIMLVIEHLNDPAYERISTFGSG